MKRIDKFILHDLLKVFRKCEVAFYVEDRRPYDSVLPSVRMRCHDILTYLEEQGMSIELYKPYKKYKVVIFTKVRKDAAVHVARKLHEEGTIVICDNFCERLTDDTLKDNVEKNNILSILSVSDYAFAYSQEQYEQFAQYHQNVILMEESVHDDYFAVKKQYNTNHPITLVYSGYVSRALYVKMIASEIARLQKEFGCKTLFLCESDPQFTEFEYEYEKYDQNIITEQLLRGDIMIAPRDMNTEGQTAHTLSKVAGPMALGLPAVASPVPSYLNTPVVICRNNEDWYYALRKLIEDHQYRQEVGEESREFIRTHYSRRVIGERYKDFLEGLISK